MYDVVVGITVIAPVSYCKEDCKQFCEPNKKNPLKYRQLSDWRRKQKDHTYNSHTYSLMAKTKDNWIILIRLIGNRFILVHSSPT